MSSGKPETRQAILEAARRLFEARATPDVELEEIAREAGVSRQAIYLHFGPRTNLMAALADHVDRTAALDELAAGVHAARSGPEELERFVRFHAGYVPRIYAIAKSFDESRRRDEAAAAVWAERMSQQRGACLLIVERLRREGALAPGWEVGEAADLLWSLTSIRAWEELVLDRGWPPERFARRIADVARRSLLET